MLVQNGAEKGDQHKKPRKSNDKVLEAYVKGLGHGNGTCKLRIYKKNYFRVFLSKKERFWPWLEEPKFVSLVFW